MALNREDAEEREAERRRDERRDEEPEQGPRDDPRSRYGHPADWHFPRGPYSPRD